MPVTDTALGNISALSGLVLTLEISGESGTHLRLLHYFIACLEGVEPSSLGLEAIILAIGRQTRIARQVGFEPTNLSEWFWRPSPLTARQLTYIKRLLLILHSKLKRMQPIQSTRNNFFCLKEIIRPILPKQCLTKAYDNRKILLID